MVEIGVWGAAVAGGGVRNWLGLGLRVWGVRNGGGEGSRNGRVLIAGARDPQLVGAELRGDGIADEESASDKSFDGGSTMNRDEFVEKYGGIYEHSPWVAEAAFGAGDLTAAMREAVEQGGHDRQLALLRAHPDLGEKLDTLTASSVSEQQGAGLNQCTPEEFAEFTQLNTAYKEKFGFPFIVAVKGLNRHDILGLFRQRINHDRDAEFRTALEQVHKIARLRLEALA